ncbi:transcriptional regulator, MarR family [Salmonella enterica subsp. enterica serovar Daytona]|uniref:Transcriptional regulator, MarR family n=1 Tax=Salmonella enterica subsp. enterica serovar Daytona TaxID=1962639 RepID=A0A447JI91_SALET|nr:transcriptional regulator, MarR family [Salmonella enterica subsp. enterica serovar Daytona]
MSENKNVQDTHISEQMKALHGALIRVVSALNRPRNDEKLIAEAGDTTRSCAIFDPY